MRTWSGTSWSSGSSRPTASTRPRRRRRFAPPSASRAADRPGTTALQIEITGGDRKLAEGAAEAALRAVGVEDGHLAVAFVDAKEMKSLNARHRGKDEPTDVLSFPVDGSGPAHGPRELGDVVICPEHTADIAEAIVHGVLHLCGYDHETDHGEMLALQARIIEDLG